MKDQRKCMMPVCAKADILTKLSTELLNTSLRTTNAAMLVCTQQQQGSSLDIRLLYKATNWGSIPYTLRAHGYFHNYIIWYYAPHGL